MNISYSQVGQDIFVYHMLKDKNQSKCVYLELGGSHPIRGNNSYNCELRGWKGLTFDISDKFIPLYEKERKNPLIIQNTITTNWDKIFKKYSYLDKNVIDYLSFDVDDANEETFKNFPFDKKRFKIITIEHNLYKTLNPKDSYDPRLSTKELTYNKLKSLNYTLVCENITHGYQPFEDWWVDSKYINKDIYEKFISNNEEGRFYYKSFL